MAQIVKKNGWWYSDFRDGDRRIRERLSPYREKAELMLVDLVKLKKSEKNGTPQSDVSWYYFTQDVLKWYKENTSPITWYTIKSALETVERYGRPITRLSQMTPRYMEGFLSKWEKAGFKRETGLSHLRRVKTAIKWAEAREMVTPRNWSLITMTPYASRVEFMEYEEYYRLLAIVQDEWRTASMLMGYAGLRSGEVRHLEWKDIDFKNRVIEVRAKWVVLPDGKKVWWEPKESLPNKPHNRKVDMGDRLETYLRSLPRKSNFVLGDYIKMHTYRQAFGERLSKKVGFKVYAHKFRHTYASFMISAGRSLEEIKVLMGHKDIRSTEIYSHLMPHRRRTAVDAMEASLPPIPTPHLEVISVHA